MGALAGLLSAALVLLPLVISPHLFFISYFVPLPFFLLGLSLGVRPLLTAGLLSILMVFLVEGPLLAAEFVLLSFAGPTLIIQRMLTSWKNRSGKTLWYSSEHIMQDCTLFAGIVMIVALGIYIYFIPDGNFHLLVKPFLEIFASHGQPHEIERLLNIIFPLLPGIFTVSWMIMMLLNMAIAQSILIHMKANLRPTPSLKTVRVPQSFLIVFALSMILSFIGVGSLELLGKNAALTLSFPFFIAGLGVVHALLGKTSFAKLSLIIFYAVLLTLFWPALIVLLLGVLRPWIEKEADKN
jgi:uncharacterized protein YybS (DUF2232 family)